MQEFRRCLESHKIILCFSLIIVIFCHFLLFSPSISLTAEDIYTLHPPSCTFRMFYYGRWQDFSNLETQQSFGNSIYLLEPTFKFFCISSKASSSPACFPLLIISPRKSLFILKKELEEIFAKKFFNFFFLLFSIPFRRYFITFCSFLMVIGWIRRSKLSFSLSLSLQVPDALVDFSITFIPFCSVPHV